MPDLSIKLRVNFDLFKIDFKVINYVMSLARLFSFKLIRSEVFEDAVNAVVNVLNMQMTYSYRRESFFFQKKVNGIIVEEVNMVLSSKEYNTYVSGTIIRGNLHARYATERSIGFINLGDFGKSK